MLVFYGVGVTVGAGIFALVGEVVGIAGDHAPLAFLVAGLIAGASGVSYAKLSSVYVRAAGEAVYVKVGLGTWPAMAVGYGVTATAIISSAVLAQAFGGYLGSLVSIPGSVLTVAIVTLLGGVAWLGVRQSVALAAVITCLEVGTLLVVMFAGSHVFMDADVIVRSVTLPLTTVAISSVFSAAIIAFFAFIGFEDIVNMAEETIKPEKTIQRAILLTLAITVALYSMIAMIAIAIPDREAMVQSASPMAVLFQSLTGLSGKPIAAVASIAMVNGILVQIVMASRVIFGMTNEGLAPVALGVLSEKRQTPGRAIGVISGLILVLALTLPLVNLAHATSLVTLSVFFLVNLSLWRIGRQSGAAPVLVRWRLWGLVGAALSAALFGIEFARLFF